VILDYGPSKILAVNEIELGIPNRRSNLRQVKYREMTGILIRD
jgi:hypothetical protein